MEKQFSSFSRDRNLWSGYAVPGKEHPRVLGIEDPGHRRRHPTQTSPARPEREEHSLVRQPPVHRQYVSRRFDMMTIRLYAGCLPAAAGCLPAAAGSYAHHLHV